jgi:hypothetical protein
MSAGFPANALLYRRGYLKQADPVVQDVRTLSEIFSRIPPRIHDNESYGDQRNLPDLKPGWKAKPGEINRAAFLIGPVMTRTQADPAVPQVADLGKYFDPTAGTITSATGELVWDYRRELCTMNAPKAQGVTGFLKRNGGKFELSAVTVESQNDYATVNLVSLDDKPLMESTQVLVQVVTENRLTGFATEPAELTIGKGASAYTVKGERITRIGVPPFRITNTQLTVTIKNSNLTEAVFLDLNGYPLTKSPIKDGSVTLPANNIYTILR